MTQPEQQVIISDADIARIVAAIENSHKCLFSEEERQIIHDMATGGKLMKKTIIYIIVALALYSILAKAAILKAGQVIGLIK